MESRLSVMFLLYLGVFLQQWLCYECQSYAVRLSGGSNIYSGRIEVSWCSTSSCSWRTVCTSGWRTTEAKVVCRQLGLYDNAALLSNYSNSGYSSYSNAVSISCPSSSYTSLGYCSVSYTVCPSVSRATVICTSPPQTTVYTPTFTRSSYYISATLRWTVHSGRAATSFIISCSNGYYSHSLPSTVLRRTLSNLIPNTRYNCRVSGIDSNNFVGSSSHQSFTTPTNTPQKAPPNLKYTRLQSRSITLQWDRLPSPELAGTFNTYTVNVQGCSESQPSTTMRAYNTTITMFVLSVCPNSVYSISVRVCTNTFCGPYSTAIQVQTPEDAPSMVNNLVCTPTTPIQVYISWGRPSQPNGVIRQYEIILYDINTSWSVSKLVNGQTTSATVDNLLPNHNYTCSVAAYTVTRGSLTTFSHVSLADFSGSEHFTCTVSSLNTLQVRLRQQNTLERNGPIQVYLVSVWNMHTNEIVYNNITEFASQDTPFVGSLDLYNTYMCSVSAYSQFGVGVFGVVPVWIPQTAQFGPPTSLQYTLITKTSFALSWEQPRVNPNYRVHIAHYRVQVYNNITKNWIPILDQFSQENSYQVDSLHPGSHYRIELSAITVVNLRGPPSIHYVQTLEDVPSGAPHNLSSFNITRSSFALSWSQPPLETQNGRIIGYRVNVTDKKSFKKSLRTDTQRESLLVTAVEEGTTYFVSVAAMTKVGVGPYGEPISITTSKGAELAIILSSVFVIFLFGVVSFGFLLCFCLRKKIFQKKIKRKLEEKDSNQNTRPPRVVLENYEYSTLNVKERVKPPAVPPKTYLNEEEETHFTKCSAEEEVECVSDDNCSAGSDSLYDMKLEAVDEIDLPNRSATTDSFNAETAHGKTQSPPFKKSRKKGSPLEQVKLKVTAGLEENEDSGVSNYQKMDVKTFNPPSKYDNIHMLPRKNVDGNHQATGGSQYEPLQLKTMKKPNEYEQVMLKKD